MGIGLLGDPSTVFKRKFRWMFRIDSVTGSPTDSSKNNGIYVLPPSASARPKLGFKEAEAQHLSETIFYPVKPDWKPINLKLYDISHPLIKENPVTKWLKTIYDAQQGQWVASSDLITNGFDGLKRDATVELYDGCGCVLETWVYENAYPMEIDFSQLEMSSNDIVMIDITLRYDRAYVLDNSNASASF